MTSPDVSVRVGTPEDLNFVFATWLRNYRHGSQFAKKISNDVFYRWHHKVIERIIERGAQIRIVHPAGDPGTILGYSCIELFEERPLVHFIYIKKAWRGMGLAKKLIWETEGYFSHMTDHLDLNRHPSFHYNPYLI